VSALETALGLALVALLAYFAYTAAGDEWPLNLALGVLALVVGAVVLFSAFGRPGR